MELKPLGKTFFNTAHPQDKINFTISAGSSWDYSLLGKYLSLYILLFQKPKLSEYY